MGADQQQARQQTSYQKSAQAPCQGWVTQEVPYILTAEERAWAAKLKTDKDCRQFIRDFWERRNPNRGSPRNKFKEQYYKRVAYAKQHFHYLGAGPGDDRARIYILFGPPDKVESAALSPKEPAVDEGETGAIKAIWVYNYIDGIGSDITVEFTDPAKSGEYRVVVDPATLRRPSG